MKRNKVIKDTLSLSLIIDSLSNKIISFDEL